MKRSFLVTLAVLVTAVGLTHVASRPAQAAVGSLEGLVQLREGGVTTPFGAVEMSLTEGSAPGGAPVASASTPADGRYSFSVEEGTYTLTAEPPDASGLTPTSRVVTVGPDSTTTENFLFTIVESQLTVSGTVTGPDGSAIAGAAVSFAGPEDDDGGTDTTDSAGAYSVDVLPRSFTVSIDVSGLGGFPDRYSLFASDVVISADTGLDVQIPGSTVTIDVVDDTTGDPITALVTAESRQAGPSILGQPSTLNSVLEEVSVVGSVDVVLAPGGTARAAASASGYFDGTESFALPATSNVELRLVPEPDPGETRLTGRLLDSAGVPIAGAPVIVSSSEPQPPTDASGEFDVLSDAPIGGGTSSVELRNPFPGGSSAVLPPLWSIGSGNVPHPEGGLTEIGDITVDAEPVTVNVVDPDGVAVPGAFFDAGNFPVFPLVPAAFGPYDGQLRTRYASDVTSDGSGTMELRLADNTGATGFFRQYELYFEPPRGIDTCEFSAYNLVGTQWRFDVSGPTTVTVEMRADLDDPRCDGGPLNPETEVTGTLLLGGVPVDNTFVGFVTPDPGGGEIRVGTATDATGAFDADVIDGDHRMDVFWTFPTDVWPRLRLDSDDTVVTTDSATDPGPIELGTFDVPLDDLDVTVLTPDGRPIPGVRVSTPTFPTVTFEMNGFDFTGTSNFPGSPSTDSNGEATLPLLPGTYDLLFTPDDGFVPFTLRDVELPEGGAGVQVQLAYPHTPPTATITPTGEASGADTFEGPVTVTVVPEAFAGFDVDSVQVSVDGAAPTEYAGPFPVTSLGEHTVVVQVTDTGSVTGPPVSRTFTIVEATDPTVPPTDPTVPPTDPTVPPTDPTVPPTDPTVPPTDPTVPPTDPTVPPRTPTDPTVPPTDPTVPPTDPTVPPTDPTVPPTDPVVPATDLPETGSEIHLALAAVLFALGVALLLVARRPRSV